MKQIIALQKARERRRQRLFLIEGRREVSLALASGYILEAMYLCPSIYQPDPAYPLDLNAHKLYHLDEALFAKLAYRDSTEGVIAVAQCKALGLDALPLKGRTSARPAKSQMKDEPPLYLLLEGIEKPGNIGAVLRSADAAGITGVIICEAVSDVYNPNVVRSSLGTLFTVPLAVAGNDEAHQWLKTHQVSCYGAALGSYLPHYEADFRKASALLMGSEAKGLSDFWLKQADDLITIPMHGKIDSINVSNAAAVISFEARRQRAALH